MYRHLRIEQLLAQIFEKQDGHGRGDHDHPGDLHGRFCARCWLLMIPMKLCG